MNTGTLRFIRHYVEMVIAMVLGMVVLGIPAEWALDAAGTSADAVQESAPAVMLLGMATIMTIPMVALMRWRGHAWRPCWEMSASMYLPTLVAIALVHSGAVEYMSAMMLEHAAMLPAMLGAMLLRPDEYACHGHREAAA